ncbi:MAG: BrnT family toxin [Spirochaetaceae bacterium]|nr:BrnT family toxin [Spirochaetaceae bacterium]
MRKHRASFPLAAKVFLDKKRIEMYDREHSTDSEDRYKVIGLVDKVLVVIYTERKEAIRLISARKAQQEEINEYYRNYDLR